MKILSIQSSVAYGHVGNSAAVFPLQRLGHEVWPVLTVHFSNHTGYGAWRGPLLAPDDVREVIAGIEDRGVLGEADAVLSGYQGDPAVGADHPGHRRTGEGAQPGRGLLLRPGDGRRRPRDVRAARDPGVHARHRRARAPTSSRPTTSSSTSSPAGPRPRSAEILDAVDEVRARGPRDVLVTSVLHGDVPEGRLDVLAVSDDGAWAVETPLLPITPERLRRRHRRALPRPPAHDRAPPRPRWRRTTSSVFAILEATIAAGTREIQLVAAQDAIADPPTTFEVRRLR